MILKHSRIFSLIIILLSAQLSWAVDASYYSSLDGKSAVELFTAVGEVANTGYAGTLTYADIWEAYKEVDAASNGDLLADIYSNCTFTTTKAVLAANNDGVGGYCSGVTYSSTCDCYNREHSLPQNWFGSDVSSGTKGVAGTDMFHVYPTDGKVNGMRSNYPYGETSSGTTWGTGRLGTSTLASSYTYKGETYSTTSYSGTVFEPDDEYKGDLARSYFYMIAFWGKYKGTNFNQGTYGAVHFNTTYTSGGGYGLTAYSIGLLMKWHRQDPVSQKEIDRNNGLQNLAGQGNRNPFIDYPCLAEYFWGDKKDETFNISSVTGSFEAGFVAGTSDGCSCAGATITSPTGTVDIGTTNTSNSVSKDIMIQGINLEGGSLTLTIGGTNGSLFKFPGSVSSTTISKANAEAGYNVTITYTPTSNNNHTATLTISGCGVTSHVVTLTGTCTTVYPVTWSAQNSTFSGPTNVAAGTYPTAPESNPANCTTKRIFVGWTAQESVSSKPADLFTTTAPTAISKATTYYAVYADTTESGGATTYSIASSIAADDQVIIACNTQGKTAGALSSTYLSSVTSTFSSDKTTITELGSGTLIFTVGGSNGAWTLTSSSGALGASATKSVNLSGTGTATWSITISSGTATITNGTSSYGSLKYNSQSPRFTTYASGQTDLQLYKVTGGITIDTTNYSLACSESSCTLSSISLNTSGVQTSFAVGDAFNYTGLVVTASYSDCVSKTVSPTSVSSPNMSTTGDKTVTVSYTEGGTTKTANYTINVETAPEYTVTFMNMGAEHATRTGTAGSAMSAISNPTACEGYTFVGWSTATQATEATSKPSTTTPTTIPAENTTYHAVYSRTESSGSGDPVITYEKVTEAPSDWSGNYLVVYETDSKVFNGLSSKGSYETTTITTGVIAHTDALELCEVVIAKMTGDNYSIQMNSSATNNASKYLSGTSGSNTMNFGESASENTIALSGSDVLLTSNTSVLRFNNDANNGNMFRYYKASGYSNQKAIQLYQRIETGGSSSTTYYTTSPNCCKATLTVQSPDDTMGTVSIE